MPGSNISLGQVFGSGLSALDSSMNSFQTVYGMFEEERNRRREVAFRADSYKNDAVIAQYEADHARAMAAIKAKEIVRSFKRQNGAMRASMAASGVVMSDGSAVDALMDRASEAGRAREMALHEGAMQAWRHENMSSQALAERSFLISQSKPGFMTRYQQARTVWGEVGKVRDTWTNLWDMAQAG